MFDKFGEFNSAAEINELAVNMRTESDTDSVLALAKENGIEEEMATIFNDGGIDIICDKMSAAIGKIDVECADLKPKEIVVDWIEYIKATCAESEELAEKVREKGKTIKGCIGELLKWSYQNCYEIDKDICTAAGIKGANVKLGIPGMARAKKIIMDYYLGGEKK